MRSKTCVVDALSGSFDAFQWETKHFLEDTLGNLIVDPLDG